MKAVGCEEFLDAAADLCNENKEIDFNFWEKLLDVTKYMQIHVTVDYAQNGQWIKTHGGSKAKAKLYEVLTGRTL